MLKTIARSAALVACILVFGTPMAFAYVSPGRPAGFLNDFAGVLSTEQKNSLEQMLVQNKQETGNEIAVVTIQSLEGDTIENFAEKLFQEWGIGEEGKDNGALLLVALEDRAMRIEVGYGLEPVLTDSIAGRIIRNDITPAFREGKYYDGITAAVTQIISVMKGEGYIGSDISPVSSEGVQDNSWVLWLALPYIFFFQWVVSILARSKSWWLGGIGGAGIGVIIGFLTTVLIGLTSGIVLAIIGLILDYIVSREYARSKIQARTPRWWAGGSGFRSGRGGFGGGSGSGGFGDFGGGRSGGGGASGSW